MVQVQDGQDYSDFERALYEKSDNPPDVGLANYFVVTAINAVENKIENVHHNHDYKISSKNLEIWRKIFTENLV